MKWQMAGLDTGSRFPLDVSACPNVPSSVSFNAASAEEIIA
jgi:hypothetical protein